MKLYVMRHGPAEDHAESGTDSDRALTASGRERVQNVARLLADLGEEPLHVLTSPLVRAVQTAEAVAVVTKLSAAGGDVKVRRELSPAGGLGSLVAELAASVASTGRKRVMLVGHEPDLSDLVASALPGAFGRAFDKGMIVGLHLGPKGDLSRIRFVLDPRALRLDPDNRDRD